MDPAEYHPEWHWVSRQIRNQANDACEFCGAPNGAVVQRNVRGDWMPVDDLDSMNSDAGWAWLGTWYPPSPVTIVLTVAHLCHDRMCIDPTHLRALCQRCHLALDRPENAIKAAATRRRNRLDRTGQKEIDLGQ